MKKDTTGKKNIKQLIRQLLNSNERINNKESQDKIRMAIDLATEIYKNQYTREGEAFIIYPLEIAIIAAEQIDLEVTSLVSALLYEGVKNKLLPIEKVENTFGKQSAIIIKDLIKISELDTQKLASHEENFIKLLLTIVKDMRSVLLKLVFRLHKMKTLEFLEKEIQLEIAKETSMLYAPIAHRLGLYSIKTNLEELSMKYSFRDIYKQIAVKLKAKIVERNQFIDEFISPLKKELTENGFDCDVKGRPKSIFSIWKKMKKQGVDVDGIYDLFAIRIILNNPFKNVKEEKAACWQVYSLATDAYTPNPKRLRDWISSPKKSGYESLHTTVIGSNGKWVEVQIRTQRMDEIAEKGHAAHWKYKTDEKKQGDSDWLNNIRTALENSSTEEAEKSDSAKQELYSNEIFIFTPKGDLKKLPYGATVLDFAYSIHSKAVGDKCVGAIINNKQFSVKHKLQNGDHVDVLTSKTQTPKDNWLNFVITAKAKNRIKRHLKQMRYKDAENGKDILRYKCSQLKLDFGEDSINKLKKHFKLKETIDLFQKIGEGNIDSMEIKKILTQKEEKINEPTENTGLKNNKFEKIAHSPEQDSKEKIFIGNENMKGTTYDLAKCCNPIFGDDIFGFVTVGKGTKVHRYDCPNAPEMLRRYPYRIIKASWTQAEVSEDKTYLVKLQIKGKDSIGLASQVSSFIVSEFSLSLRSIQLDANDGFFEGNVMLYVKDTKQLTNLIEKLLAIKGIMNVKRIDV